MRLLQRAWPDGHVLVRPELPLIRKDILGPGQLDDLPCLLEARPGLRHVHVVGHVFPRNAPNEPGDDAAAGHAIGHRQLLRQPQRLVDRQRVAVDQDLQALGDLRGRGRHEVRRVHQAVGRGVVLVESHAIETELVHVGPRLQMLPVVFRRHLGSKVTPGQRIRETPLHVQMVQSLRIGQQIEGEDFHRRHLPVSGPSIAITRR